MGRMKLLFAEVFMFLLPSLALAAVYGAGVGGGRVLSVSEVLDKPSEHVGKVVVVEGTIVDVCAARGCWLELAGDKPGQKLKIKVEDGVIVFPLEARGKKGKVQGKLQEMTLTKEQAVEAARHYAEETGKPYDPSRAQAGTVYRVRATGAVIP